MQKFFLNAIGPTLLDLRELHYLAEQFLRRC